MRKSLVNHFHTKCAIMQRHRKKKKLTRGVTLQHWIQMFIVRRIIILGIYTLKAKIVCKYVCTQVWIRMCVLRKNVRWAKKSNSTFSNNKKLVDSGELTIKIFFFVLGKNHHRWVFGLMYHTLESNIVMLALPQI